MYSNIVKKQSYKCLRVSVLHVQTFEGEETYKCLTVFSDIKVKQPRGNKYIKQNDSNTIKKVKMMYHESVRK